MEEKPDPKKLKDSDLSEKEADHWRMKFETRLQCPYKYFKREKDEPEVS